MSQYELRAQEICDSALSHSWNISWRCRNGRVYATVKVLGGHPFQGTPSNIKAWLSNWYSEPRLTSGGYRKWTFCVFDIIETLKGHNVNC
jgi:hypothetical protein